MNDDIFELRMNGHCCSQIIMGLGLKKLGKENPDLIRAMAGLCNGAWQESLCGILSAAICLLFLADAEASLETHIQELNEWFEDSFGSRDCKVLLGENPLSRAETCPLMVAATFQKICELLDWEEE